MYRLPHHVFFCFSGSHCIFLDIDRDQYLAIDREPIETLTPWLSLRSNNDDHPTPEKEIPTAVASIADDLLAQGLLTPRELDGKPFKPVSTPPPRARSVRRQRITRNVVRFAGFYAACSVANRYLTAARTKDAIDLVRRRKASQCQQVPGAPNQLLSLLSTFDALRPFYPRPYLCLFDSLALVEFLARYRIFPTWVFGVCGEPFQAHCWVQHQDLLLNDSVEHVSTFTPIMTV